MKCTVHAAFAFYTKEVYSNKTNFEVTFSVTSVVTYLRSLKSLTSNEFH